METGISLAGLSDSQFRTWAPKGIDELRQLLLFRWDPDRVSSEFPASEDQYDGIARTVVLGLRMGDDRDRFDRRLGHELDTAGWLRADALVLDRLWNLTSDWLPRSLEHWWVDHLAKAEFALPHHFSLLGSGDVAERMTRAEWLRRSIAIAELSVADGPEDMVLRRDAEFVARRLTQEVLLDLGKALEGDVSAGYQWSTQEVDFVLRVCQDEDLHVSSARPLDQSSHRATSERMLRE